MTGEWNDEGRARVILDTLFHSSDPLPVTISGMTVDVQLEASDIQIGAVEIKNATTDDRATVTAGGDLQVTLASEVIDVSGSSVTADTELLAPAGLGDLTANPTITSVGSFLMGFDAGSSDWARIRQHVLASDGRTGTNRGLLTASYLYGYDGAVGGDWNRVKVSDINVDQHVPTDYEHALSTASYLYGYNELLDRWVRLQSMDPGGGSYSPTSDDGVQVVFAGVAGLQGSGWQQINANLATADGVSASEMGLVGNSRLYGFNGSTWDRLLVDSSGNLAVTVSGITATLDTEFGPAFVLNDRIDIPTTAPVGSFNYVFSNVLNQWQRASSVDLASGTGGLFNPATDQGVLATYSVMAGVVSGGTYRPVANTLPDNDAVASTAFGLHSNAFQYGYNGTTWDRLRSSIAAGLLVDTELPAAAALTDLFANPTAPAVGSFNMAFNETLGLWVRVQSMDSTTGNWNASTDDGVMNTYAITAGSSSNGVYHSIGARQPTADAYASGRFAMDTAAFGYGWNGATWDRLRSSIAGGLEVELTNAEIVVSGILNVNVQGNDSDAVAELADNVLDTNSYLMGHNGTTWDRLVSSIAQGLEVDVTQVQGTVTVDSELPAASALADDMANPTTPLIGAANMVWDVANSDWDRSPGSDSRDDSHVAALNEVLPVGKSVVHGKRGNSLDAIESVVDFDGDNFGTYFQLLTASANRGFNGSTWDRLRSDGNDGDAVAELALGVLGVNSFLMGHNGTTWDRLVSSTAQGLEVDVTQVQGEVTLGTGDTVLRATISEDTLGSNELVAAVGGEQIKVLSVLLVASGIVNAKFQSNLTDLTGALLLDPAGAGFVLSPPANKDMHHFETASGEALNLDLTDDVHVGGFVVYYTEA